MDRRLLLAVILSSAILFTYPLILARIYPQSAQPVAKSQTKPSTVATPAAPIMAPSPKANGPAVTHQVSGPEISLLYSDRSGGIQRLILPQYRDLRTQQSVTLLDSPETSEHLLSLMTDDAAGTGPPLVDSYHADYTSDGADFSAATPGGLQINKSFTMQPGGRVIECSLRVHNPTDRAQELRAQVVLALQPMNGAAKTSYTAPIEAVLTTRDKQVKISQPSVVKRPKHRPEQPTQAALLERHFCLIATVPPNAGGAVASATSDGHGLRIALPIVTTVAPGATEEMHWKLYAGPRDYHHVRAIGQGFEESLRLGILGHIGLFLLMILKTLNAVAHNYGIAIILLTVLVSVLLVPFNLMSLKVMQRMKAMQPLSEALRVKHKGDQDKFNKEYMALMKKHRINPLAGCLVPLLVQMPIFFALLQVLSNSIELRGAGFLWIDDLSSPDRLAKLPFTLPFFGDELHLLPLLTIVAMFLQQKISQASMGAASPKGTPDMSVIMLVMFGVWMYHAPSGPVLYWLVNTVIMVIWYKLVNLRPVALEP